MEDIAEINDLACSSIEAGDYHTALKALNRCLGCIKYLRRRRLSSCVDGNESTLPSRIHIDSMVSEIILDAKRTLILSTKNFSVKRNVDAIHSSFAGDGSQRPTKRKRLAGEMEQTTAAQGTVFFSSIESNFSSTVPVNRKEKNSTEYDDDDDDGPFVSRKPVRLSKFQWSRVIEAKGTLSKELGTHYKSESHEDLRTLEREIELMISSNLIFNIALSHHLIAIRPAQYRPSIERNNNIPGFQVEQYTQHDSMQKEQRLQGALRLYELAFKIHAKCSLSASSVSHRLSPSQRSSPSQQIVSRATQTPTSMGIQGLTLTVGAGSRNFFQNEGDIDFQNSAQYTLALINNCTQIYKSLGNCHSARIFRDRLLSFLMTLVDRGQCLHDIVNDDQTLDGYLKSVFEGTVFKKDEAPAAMA